jgi:hypothetical protein
MPEAKTWEGGGRREVIYWKDRERRYIYTREIGATERDYTEFAAK